MHANNLKNWSMWSAPVAQETLALLRNPLLVLFLVCALLLILPGCGTTDSPSGPPKASVPGELMAPPLGPVWLNPPTSLPTSGKTPNAGGNAAPKSGDGKPGPASMVTPPERSAMAGDTLEPLDVSVLPEKRENPFARIAYKPSAQARTYRDPIVSGLQIRCMLPRRV